MGTSCPVTLPHEHSPWKALEEPNTWQTLPSQVLGGTGEDAGWAGPTRARPVSTAGSACPRSGGCTSCTCLGSEGGPLPAEWTYKYSIAFVMRKGQILPPQDKTPYPSGNRTRTAPPSPGAGRATCPSAGSARRKRRSRARAPRLSYCVPPPRSASCPFHAYYYYYNGNSSCHYPVSLTYPSHVLHTPGVQLGSPCSGASSDVSPVPRACGQSQSQSQQARTGRGGERQRALTWEPAAESAGSPGCSSHNQFASAYAAGCSHPSRCQIWGTGTQSAPETRDPSLDKPRPWQRPPHLHPEPAPCAGLGHVPTPTLTMRTRKETGSEDTGLLRGRRACSAAPCSVQGACVTDGGAAPRSPKSTAGSGTRNRSCATGPPGDGAPAPRELRPEARRSARGARDPSTRTRSFQGRRATAPLLGADRARRTPGAGVTARATCGGTAPSLPFLRASERTLRSYGRGEPLLRARGAPGCAGRTDAQPHPSHRATASPSPPLPPRPSLCGGPAPPTAACRHPSPPPLPRPPRRRLSAGGHAAPPGGRKGRRGDPRQAGSARVSLRRAPLPSRTRRAGACATAAAGTGTETPGWAPAEPRGAGRGGRTCAPPRAGRRRRAACTTPPDPARPGPRRLLAPAPRPRAASTSSTCARVRPLAARSPARRRKPPMAIALPARAPIAGSAASQSESGSGVCFPPPPAAR